MYGKITYTVSMGMGRRCTNHISGVSGAVTMGMISHGGILVA
jgi:hypothetical protein